MNITGYNLETLRKKIRDLQEENNKLKELLKKSNIIFDEQTNNNQDKKSTDTKPKGEVKNINTTTKGLYFSIHAHPLFKSFSG